MDNASQAEENYKRSKVVVNHGYECVAMRRSQVDDKVRSKTMRNLVYARYNWINFIKPGSSK